MSDPGTARSVGHSLAGSKGIALLLILAIPLLCAMTPGTPEYYISLAQKHNVAGNPAAAYACLKRAIALAPNLPEGYTSRAFLSLKQGERKLAIADFTKVIELRPNDAAMYLSRGFIYAEEGDNDQAQADFRRACDIDGSGCSFLDSKR